MTRRLLNHHQVAEKIGYTPDWFYRHRNILEAKGFPAALKLSHLPDGKGNAQSQNRWDEKAIDLWLDQQLPAHLRDAKPKLTKPEISMIDLASKLAGRARELPV